MKVSILSFVVTCLGICASVDNTTSVSLLMLAKLNACLILQVLLQAMSEGIKAATDDLRKKSISLAQSHYGSLSYILAYAASGSECEIHVINTDGQVRPSDVHCVHALAVQALTSFLSKLNATLVLAVQPRAVFC